MTNQLDFSQPYWQHVQIRQAQMITYLSNYLNLLNSVVIYSPFFDLVEAENQSWIYAHSIDKKDSLEATQLANSTDHKLIYLEATALPFSPDSVANMIIGIGTPLEQISAMLNECYTVIKPGGFLILIYPNKRNFLWSLSSTIRALQNKVKAPSTVKLMSIAQHWHFHVIENFTFSLIPPIILKYIPLIQGKWDDWCAKIPIPIGQYNALILQKKTVHLISENEQKKLTYSQLRPCLQSYHTDYQCPKK